MGGQSFKCPNCDKWFLSKVALKDHLVAKHQQPKGFTIEDTGPRTYVKSKPE